MMDSIVPAPFRRPNIPKSEWIGRWYDWLDTFSVLAAQTRSPERADEIGVLISDAKTVIRQVADEVYARYR